MIFELLNILSKKNNIFTMEEMCKKLQVEEPFLQLLLEELEKKDYLVRRTTCIGCCKKHIVHKTDLCSWQLSEKGLNVVKKLKM
jgi:hypothetical protein